MHEPIHREAPLASFFIFTWSRHFKRHVLARLATLAHRNRVRDTRPVDLHREGMQYLKDHGT